MLVVALVAISFWAFDTVRMNRRSERYRSYAAYNDEMVRRCRDIVAMDPIERARKSVEAYDDPYLFNPAWTKEMISYHSRVRDIFAHAAEHPREPLPPHPQNP
ncbi:hypothetical protein GC170_16505 [bacterium]|nr:hypothetical protein [bacterium]